MPRLTGHLQPRRNWPTWVSIVLIAQPILRISGLPLVPWTKKKQLKDRHFPSDAEVIAAAETWLDGQFSEFFVLSGLQNLEQRTKKYIELRGEYVEYVPSLVTVACFLPGRAKDLSAHPRKNSKKIKNRMRIYRGLKQLRFLFDMKQ